MRQIIGFLCVLTSLLLGKFFQRILAIGVNENSSGGCSPLPPPTFQYTQNLLTHTVILRQLKNLIEPTTIYYLCSTLCNVVYWDSSAELSVNCAMYLTCMCGKQFTVYRSRLTLFTVRPPPHTWLSAFNATL